MTTWKKTSAACLALVLIGLSFIPGSAYLQSIPGAGAQYFTFDDYPVSRPFFYYLSIPEYITFAVVAGVVVAEVWLYRRWRSARLMKETTSIGTKHTSD